MTWQRSVKLLFCFRGILVDLLQLVAEFETDSCHYTQAQAAQQIDTARKVIFQRHRKVQYEVNNGLSSLDICMGLVIPAKGFVGTE